MYTLQVVNISEELDCVFYNIINKILATTNTVDTIKITNPLLDTITC